MVDLAKLVVRLEAENSKLTKALQKSSNDLRRFEGQAKRSFNAVKNVASTAFAGISVGLFAAGLKRTVSSTLDANDRIAKLAQTTGIAVEELNAFDLAANLSGVSLDVFAKGAQRLQRNMFDAAAGLKESKDSFDALGIAVLDNQGNLRNTTDVILDLAEKFSKIEDGAGKAALAQRLLGRSGAELIPLLNEGGSALAGYIEEQKRFGNVLTAEVAAASERVNDNFTRLDVAAQGVSRAFTEGMLPSLESVTNEMVNLSAGSNDAIRELGSFGGSILKSGLSAVLALKAGLDVTGNAIGRFAAALAAVGSGEFSRALDILTDETGGFIDEYKQAADSIVRIWDDVSVQVQAKADSNAGKIASPVIIAADKAKTAAKGITQAVKDEMDIALDLLIQEEEALTRQAGKEIAGLSGPTDAQRRAAEIFESTRTSAEKFSAEIAELNDLLDEGAISWDTYERAVANAQDEYTKVGKEASTLNNAARDLGYTFESAFENAVINGEKLRDVLRGLLKDIARIVLRETVSAPIAGFISGAISSYFSAPSTGFTGTQVHQFASGTSYAPGGPAIVGEEGPELVYLPRGSRVTPNDQLGGVTINVDARGSTDPMATERAVKRAVNESISTFRDMKIRGRLPEFA